MFASFSLERSVWAHPLVGYVNGILLFLKNQLRGYLRNVFDLVGGRKIAPLWDSEFASAFWLRENTRLRSNCCAILVRAARRNMGTQFFTQEYEGRDTDISLIPWQGHRSLTSAMFSLIKNPTQEEFEDWVRAAERETWKHIPRIKSHCAEEQTLDLCVQRLRKKIMVESWEARHSSSQQMLQPIKGGDGTMNLNNRTPSFFQSPSLVCMGGLAVLDPYESVESIGEEKKEANPHGRSPSPGVPMSDHVDGTSGWGGMGLRGNHSFNNLHASGGSGIFFGEDSENEQDEGDANLGPKTGSWASKVGSPDGGYIKTSHMANFYYRRERSASLSEAASDEKDEGRDARGRPHSASMIG